MRSAGAGGAGPGWADGGAASAEAASAGAALCTGATAGRARGGAASAGATLCTRATLCTGAGTAAGWSPPATAPPAGHRAPGRDRHCGRNRPAAPAQPQPQRDGEAAGQGRAEDQEGAQIGPAARRGIGVIDEIVGVGGSQQGADPDEARFDAVPAVGVRVAERDIGIAREAAGDFALIAGKPGGVGDTGGVRQLGDEPLGDLVGMLQRIVPAFERGRAKAAHRLRLGLGQPAQREQRVAVELDAIIGRVEGFQRNPLFARQKRHLPGRADRGIDSAVGERGGDAAGAERDQSELRWIDPLGLERGGKLDVEDVAGRQPPELCLGERAGRGEIGIGPVIDRRAALLENRRQQ